MIPIINQAMMLGYTASQILSFIQNKIPNMSSGVTNARKRGYKDEDILKFLSSKLPVKNEESLSKGQGSDYLSSVGIKTKEQRKNDRNKAIKTAIGIGSTALTAYKAYQNYAGIAQGLTNYFTGGNPQQPTPNTPVTSNPMPSPMQATPGQVIQAQANTPAQTAQIAQASQAIPKGPPTPTLPTGQKPSIFQQLTQGIDLQSLPEDKKKNIAFLQTITDKLEAQGKTIDDPVIKKIYTKINNLISGKQTVLDEEINRFEKGYAKDTEMSDIEETKPQKIQKGSEVLTPDGIGTVKGEDSKGLIVESDGKATKIPYEEAISSPLPEKDMADLYSELVNKIPESERSSMINVAGYDPNVNEFIFMPHDGALYVYKDIPEEFAEKLKAALFQAKTTGSNFYGAWSKGEESRGAGLSALIKDLQKLYGGKGKEYIRKYEKVYDFFALPKQAIKEKERMEREKRKKAKRPS